MDSSEAPGGVPAESSVPAMPTIQANEQSANPYPVREGLRYTIAWQFRLRDRGGSAFVLMGPGAFGLQKVLDRYPLTEAGWSRVWRALAQKDPEAAAKIRVRLSERESQQRELEAQLWPTLEDAELASRTFARLWQVALLGGYGPSAELVIGKRYDLRFLDDRLAVLPGNSAQACMEVHYHEVEDVEIGGPGLVRSGGGFAGGGFGAVGALEGMAIAAVLNALTTRTTITTIVRVQAIDCELFLLHTRSTPDQLRMELSRALGAIRAARTAAAQSRKPDDEATGTGSPVAELSKLAEMLQAGLLTREEFDLLKAKLLQG